jgi:hypothetical protein
MPDLDAFLSRQLSRGRITFTREDALRTLPADSLTAALSQLIRKGRIANPRQGFYLILQPEDRQQGAPDPARWIHALMKHQKIDYRISLLTAAKFHGATQEPEAFQLIVPTIGPALRGPPGDRGQTPFSGTGCRSSFMDPHARGLDDP